MGAVMGVEMAAASAGGGRGDGEAPVGATAIGAGWWWRRRRWWPRRGVEGGAPRAAMVAERAAEVKAGEVGTRAKGRDGGQGARGRQGARGGDGVARVAPQACVAAWWRARGREGGVVDEAAIVDAVIARGSYGTVHRVWRPAPGGEGGAAAYAEQRRAAQRGRRADGGLPGRARRAARRGRRHVMMSLASRRPTEPPHAGTRCECALCHLGVDEHVVGAVGRVRKLPLRGHLHATASSTAKSPLPIRGDRRPLFVATH